MLNIFSEFKKNILQYLFFASLILISNETYLFATSGYKFLEIFKYAYIFFIAIIMFFRTLPPLKDLLITLTFFVLFILFSYINGGGVSGGPILLTCSIFIAISTVRKYNLTQFAQYFSGVVICISIYSLILWSAGTIHILPMYSTINTAGAPILSSGGCIFFSLHGNSWIIRNSAFFREPGVFMIFINFAFLLEAFVLRKKISIKKFIVYALSVFSTLSTAGFIIFGVLLILYTLQNSTTKSFRNILIPIVILLGAGYGLQNSEISDSVFGKLEKGEKSRSYLGRVSSITIPLEMTLQHPVFGCGIDQFENNYKKIAYQQYGFEINPQGMATNTILNSSATFGIWYAIFLLWGLYKFSNRLYIPLIHRLAIFLCMIMALSNEVLTYSIFIYWFIFYGYISNRYNIKKINQSELLKYE